MLVGETALSGLDSHPAVVVVLFVIYTLLSLSLVTAVVVAGIVSLLHITAVVLLSAPLYNNEVSQCPLMMISPDKLAARLWPYLVSISCIIPRELPSSFPSKWPLASVSILPNTVHFMGIWLWRQGNSFSSNQSGFSLLLRRQPNLSLIESPFVPEPATFHATVKVLGRREQLRHFIMPTKGERGENTFTNGRLIYESRVYGANSIRG